MTVAPLRHTEKAPRNKRVRSPAARTPCPLLLKRRAGPQRVGGPLFLLGEEIPFHFHVNRQARSTSHQRSQLHGQAHVPADLELPRHESHLRIQPAGVDFPPIGYRLGNRHLC
jgi:hypothetical protein